VIEDRSEKPVRADAGRAEDGATLAEDMEEEHAPADAGRAEDGAPLTERPELLLPSGCAMAKDASGFWVVLLPSSWTIGYLEEKNPAYSFGAEPPSPPRTA
jgi:hypothetical protein